MTPIEEKIKSLSMYIAKLYFEEKDYSSLSSYLAENITWIGIGKNEICLNREEIVNFFKKEIAVFDIELEIVEQWYKCEKITEDSYCVMAVIKVKADEEASVLPLDTLRFSVIWKRSEQDDGWKIIHIHNSLPDGGFGAKNDVNPSIGQSTDQGINQSIRNAFYLDDLTKINNKRVLNMMWQGCSVVILTRSMP